MKPTVRETTGKKKPFQRTPRINGIGAHKNAKDPYLARYLGPRTQTEKS